MTGTEFYRSMTEEEENILIQGCKKRDRQSQKSLYQAFYGYAMSICLRYGGNAYEASEILNDGFFKVFTQIHKYDSSRAFKPWLGRIICNTSIDYYRSNFKKQQTTDIEKAAPASIGIAVEQKMNYEDLLALVQKLPATYRTVFNLYAIDGFSHEEIGKLLNITAGTSRSNLFKARQHLQQMLKEKGISGNDRTSTDTPIVPINQPLINPVFHPNYKKS